MDDEGTWHTSVVVMLRPPIDCDPVVVGGGVLVASFSLFLCTGSYYSKLKVTHNKQTNKQTKIHRRVFSPKTRKKQDARDREESEKGEKRRLWRTFLPLTRKRRKRRPKKAKTKTKFYRHFL